MMLQHGFRDWPREFDSLQDVVSTLGVLFLEVQLCFGQLARLAVDFSGDLKFAEVVHDSGKANAPAALPGQIHFRGDRHGEPADPRLMPAAARIVHFYRSSDGLDGGFQTLPQTTQVLFVLIQRSVTLGAHAKRRDAEDDVRRQTLQQPYLLCVEREWLNRVDAQCTEGTALIKQRQRENGSIPGPSRIPAQ